MRMLSFSYSFVVRFNVQRMTLISSLLQHFSGHLIMPHIK